MLAVVIVTILVVVLVVLMVLVMLEVVVLVVLAVVIVMLVVVVLVVLAVILVLLIVVHGPGYVRLIGVVLELVHTFSLTHIQRKIAMALHMSQPTPRPNNMRPWGGGRLGEAR